MAAVVQSLSPGVYLQEVASRPSPVLETGVPAFVGMRHSTAPADLIALAQKLGISGLVSAVPQPVALDASTWTTLDTTFGAGWARYFLGFSVRGFFENGGRRCHVITHSSSSDFQAALAQLEALDDFDVLCAPDSAAAGNPTHLDLLGLCDKRPGCFALLDGPGRRRLSDPVAPPPGATVPSALIDVTTNLAKVLRDAPIGDQRVNGAFYAPWVKVRGACPDPDCARNGKGCQGCGGTGQGFVPPCGHVAGVLSRLDHRIGVHRAPANEPMEGVFDVQLTPDDATMSKIRDAGLSVNWIRALPGRGIRPWGARTVALNHPQFAHVNTRRTYLTVLRWLERMAADMTFEPNDLRLWLRIHREVTTFLDGLHRQGALQGATAAEAFHVKCDAETNPPAVREAGMTVAEIGLALARPCELVVVRLLTGPGGSAVSGTESSTVSGR